MRTINIPSTNTNGTTAINLEKNLIIVGANGSGKTRFGSNIEQYNNPSQRISAQRYLQLSEIVQKQDFETANQQLKQNYKNKPVTQPQGDYQQVLVSLFAEEARRNEKVIEQIKQDESMTKDTLPSSIKEKVIEVWNSIFPYREIKLEKDRVLAINDSNIFSANEMSDGEKVGLYLISQTLLADENCILIIDEPELHLHKSLMIRIWNKLEQFRSDCTFIYITHDLDFAVSKPSSKIIWIQNYKNNIWNWKELDANGTIPENLFLEVLGSRKPILFVEGEKGSLDILIYQTYYENYTIIPCGSCTKVIEAVKGMKEHQDLHDKQIYGIIDTDFHSTDQLAAFNKDGIFNIGLNEIENIFLIPEIIELVCTYLMKDEKKEIIISKIIEEYEQQKDKINFLKKKSQAYKKINESFGGIKETSEYEIRKSNIINDLDQRFLGITDIPETTDIIEILKLYPHKGLVRKIQQYLELSGDCYRNLVLGFLNDANKKQTIINIFRNYLPEIN